MLLNKLNPNALSVYLEHQQTRDYVGKLEYNTKTNHFIFTYAIAYRRKSNAIPMGPNLPLNKQEIKSRKLFPEFFDRIPEKSNPAYKEYCELSGIKPDEAHPIKLLLTLGKRGPSHFILEPNYEEQYELIINKLKSLMKKTNLSQKDVAHVLEISIATLQRVMIGKSCDRGTLRLIDIVVSKPEILLEIIRTTAQKIHSKKLCNLLAVLKKNDY